MHLKFVRHIDKLYGEKFTDILLSNYYSIVNMPQNYQLCQCPLQLTKNVNVPLKPTKRQKKSKKKFNKTNISL
jgi:hypothetical protein